ncbi:hypothetical protein LXL04_023598 [Taraxacum kok-saghyz]
MVLTIWELRKGLKHPDLDKAYDIDLFSVHDINEMVRDIGYLTETPLFYQYCKPNIYLDYELMPLGKDQDVLTMMAYIPRHREISVYIATGETTTYIYDKSPSKVIIEELVEPVPLVVSPEMDKGIKWSRGGQGSCSKKLKLDDNLVESSQPQSQVINDGVWDPNGKDLVPFVSTQVSQLSQVINPQVEALVGTEPEKGDEVNVVTEPLVNEVVTEAFVDEVVIEDVDRDIGAGDEQGLGQHVENDMFAELEDMIDHDYSIFGDINGQYNVIKASEDEITVYEGEGEGEGEDEGEGEGEEQGDGEGQGEGVGECEGEGEGQDSLDTDFFVQDSNLHFDVDVDMSEFMSDVDVDEHGIMSGAKNLESFDNVDDELRPVDLDGGQFAGFTNDERKRMLMELNRPSSCSEGVVHAKALIAGQFFKTKDEVKYFVSLHDVNSRRALYLAKNDKIRVRVTCKGAVGESGDDSGGPATRSKVKGKGKNVINNQTKCPWAVQISRSNENEDWMVKTENDHHKCLQTSTIKSCTSKFLATNILQQIQNNPSIPIKALHEELTVKMQLGLSKQKVARAKRMAAKGHQWRLPAVGIDSNNGIYPLAYAVVEAETFQSWTWFLELLEEDLNLGLRSNFTFISDRQKGLLPAISKTFPNAEHRYCLRHIQENLKKISKDKNVSDQVWKCGRATAVNHFQRAMDELKEMHERVHHTLSVIPASSWTKSHFSETHPNLNNLLTSKTHTDCLLNNLCEVFNSKIEDARDQPIITCLEYIREYLMKRLCVVQEAINKCETLLTPTATQLFEVIKKEAARYIAHYNGVGKYQVGCPWQDQYVVDLNDRSCTCRNWEITGMPCKHAVAAIWDMIANSEDSSPVEEYVHPCYKTTTWISNVF